MTGLIIALTLIAGPATAQTTTSSSARNRFQLEVDPVTDTAVLVSTIGFVAVLEMVMSTGELRPQVPEDTSRLLPIDRWRAESDSVHDIGLSNFALSALGVYAVTDIALMGILSRGDDWTDYAVVYAESVALTFALTDLIKIAVRRPRPTAYQLARNGQSESEDTNTALSFLSGHSSVAATLAATASYLAWMRDDASLTERWTITAANSALTLLVATTRVTEGKHFPTDVISGLVFGAGIGVLVPHLHMQNLALRPTVTLGEDLKTVGVTGQF